VFDVTNPTNKRWLVVLQGRTMHSTDEKDYLILDISETPSFSTNMPTLNVDNEVDDMYATHDYHHGAL